MAGPEDELDAPDKVKRMNHNVKVRAPHHLGNRRLDAEQKSLGRSDACNACLWLITYSAACPLFTAPTIPTTIETSIA